MRKFLYTILCIASSQMQAQPFPETQVSEFKVFVLDAIKELEQHKCKSLAMVLKSPEGYTSEIFYYTLNRNGNLDLVHATLEQSSNKLFYDSYEYKNVRSEYFLLKHDTMNMKAAFSEMKIDNKIKVTVSKLEVPNCRSGYDTTETRTYLFDEQNRLLSIANTKRTLKQNVYSDASLVKSISFDMRCSSCGNGNEAAVVSYDTLQTNFTYSKSNVTSTSYDFIEQNTSTQKYMNCEWESESLKSTKVIYKVITAGENRVSSAQIFSTELHNNELNINTGISSKLIFYFEENAPSIAEDYIEQLLQK